MSRGRVKAWLEVVLRGREQVLEDLAVARSSSVSFVRGVGAPADTFIAELERRAARRGYVVAELSLAALGGIDAFDSVVRTVLRVVGAPDELMGQGGVARLVEDYVAEQGHGAAATLAAALDREGVHGELGTLALAFAEETRGPRREQVRLQAWIDGTELRAARAHDVSGALTLKSSKRALADLSRLVLALGYRGLLIVLTRGESCSKLPAGRRRDAYTLLRELVDNVDGGRGLVATSIVVVGGPALFEGPRSLHELKPLAMRVDSPEPLAGYLTPHATCIDLERIEQELASASPGELPTPTTPDAAQARSLRALLRLSHGLPPTEGVPALSVGFDKIDATISRLFEHANAGVRGSTFALLSGEYGSGKTHLLQHLTERGLEDRRPVLRLAVERLDADLGNPQRHLRRLLEDAVLPLPGRPSLLDLASRWRRTRGGTKALLEALTKLEAGEGETSGAAHQALLRARAAARAVQKHGSLSEAQARVAPEVGEALESFLGGAELVTKTASPSARRAAYERLLLWLALLEELEQLSGTVLIIDEAENLYRGGVSAAERRTALRSLAFYCGGHIAGGCVFMALTPAAIEELSAEAGELLEQLSEQVGALALEEPTLLARRMKQAKPIQVPALNAAANEALAEAVRREHARVRGRTPTKELGAWVGQLSRSKAPPRVLVRQALHALEQAWWSKQ